LSIQNYLSVRKFGEGEEKGRTIDKVELTMETKVGGGYEKNSKEETSND
jgi:hypothetical protein